MAGGSAYSLSRNAVNEHTGHAQSQASNASTLKFNSVGQRVISPELSLPRPLFKLRNIFLVTAITIADTQHVLSTLLALSHAFDNDPKKRYCKRAHFADEDMEAQRG